MQLGQALPVLGTGSEAGGIVVELKLHTDHAANLGPHGAGVCIARYAAVAQAPCRAGWDTEA